MMAPVRQAMLMAAGLGTRLRPFTDRLAKPMLPVMDIPIAQYAMDALAQAGVERVIANVHHLARETERGLKALELHGMSLEISDESDLLLGSAGGLRKALPLFGGEPFFLVNGDVLCDIDLGRLAGRHAKLRAQSGVALTLTVFPRPKSAGKYREIRFDEGTGLLTGLGEVVAGKPYFVGAAVIEPEAMAEVPASGPAEFVPTILQPAIKQRRAGAFLTNGDWHDIGSPELWLDTHVRLIESLETGRMHPLWRSRIESMNRRAASGIWVSRRHESRPVVVEWGAPAYWSGTTAPRVLGPRSVLYGALPAEARSESGIGYDGLWVNV